jgi:RHS repeat-associated protein
MRADSTLTASGVCETDVRFSRPLFTGKERDSESGNDYFGARYYASSMGRWISPDWSAGAEAVPYASLDNPQSLNLYGYAGNNPLRNIDLDGHIYNGQCDSGESTGCLGNGRGATEVETPSAVQDGWQSIQEAHNDDVAKAQQQSAPTPLKDKNGNVVTGASGQPALIPAGFDIKPVLKAAAVDGPLMDDPNGASLIPLKDLSNFGRGGKWDLQRLSGKFDARFIDSATILIGMYAAAGGISRGDILSTENDVAKNSKYAAGTQMDSIYTHLPVRNVTNTDIGMRLIQSGAIPVP